jgi:hypothetical protein
MNRRAACLALVLLAGGAAPAPAAPGKDTACPALGDVDFDAASLTHVAAALKSGHGLNVLAVGSASLQPDNPAPPQGAGAPAQSGGPWQMARALEAAVHGLHVSVTLRTGHDLEAGEMAEIISAELARGHYQLVLWQTGTVDAVQDAPPGDFYQALLNGAADITGAGADLVLVDPQFSRFLQANANLQPYLSAMQAVADLPGVSLFDRYRIMRGWADDGAIDLERTPIAGREAAAARLHMCLGRALARLLMGAEAGTD